LTFQIVTNISGLTKITITSTTINPEVRFSTMALHIFADPVQGAYFVLIIILIPIGVLATVLRFVATQKARRRPGLEDWLALAALISFLANTILAEICAS
jgi:hypothetical protein